MKSGFRVFSQSTDLLPAGVMIIVGSKIIMFVEHHEVVAVGLLGEADDLVLEPLVVLGAA